MGGPAALDHHQSSPLVVRKSPMLASANAYSSPERLAGQDQYQNYVLSEVPKFCVTQQEEILSQHSQFQAIGGGEYPVSSSDIIAPSSQAQGGLQHDPQPLPLPPRDAALAERPLAAGLTGRDDVLDNYRLSIAHLEHANSDLTRRLTMMQVIGY